MKQKTIYSLLICILFLTACGGNAADLTPTLSSDQVQTQAIETFSAALTQTALVAPTETPSPTLTISPTSDLPTANPVITLPATTQIAVASPTLSCYQLRFVSDVTIPDNTAMKPGQTFTKTWKVKNIGSCAWDAGFKFAFVGGDAMSGATYTLPSAVAAGSETDISIAMTAPNKAGAIRGNWRMTTASGQYFGDEVYVLINVGGATLTPTKTGAPTTATPATPSATPNTPSATPDTPVVDPGTSDTSS